MAAAGSSAVAAVADVGPLAQDEAAAEAAAEFKLAEPATQ